MFNKLKSLFVAATGLCALASFGANADVLLPGQQLTVGQELIGHNGQYKAIMQGDGNFVVYHASDSRAVWSTGTVGSGADHIFMQADGNLVMYTPDGRAVWSSGTDKQNNQNNQFTVDDLGRAMLFAEVATWYTNTGEPNLPPNNFLEFQAGFRFQPGQIFHQENGFDLTFQTDGNFVLLKNGVPTWASNVTRNSKGKAIYALFARYIQTWNDDGGVWGSKNQPIPDSIKGDRGDFRLANDQSRLVLQSDGNLVIYEKVRVWGAPVADPAPPSVPPGKEPHCIGDPHACR